MCRGQHRDTSVGDGGVRLRHYFRPFANNTSTVAITILSGLVCLALMVLVRPAQSGSDQLGLSPHPHFSDPDLAALRAYAQDIVVRDPQLANVGADESNRLRFAHADLAALPGHPQQIGVGHPHLANVAESDIGDVHSDDSDFMALDEYTQRIGTGRHNSSIPASFKVAAARQFTPIPDPYPNARHVGAQTCLFCHARQAELFSKTLMGRIDKTHRGKLDCETCHGPGSAHVQAVGCASCHGERGISKVRGTPSLVGLDPQYLVAAMKAYVTGERKHELKRMLMAGISDADLRDIALYYARQPAAPAQTPAVGNAAAGRTSTASCAACHGAQGVSVIAGWPSLAGQDSQYLADATRAYKRGSRNKVIACGACHGERGISRLPGMPNLAGLEAQYLIAAMKAYVTGERKHELKRLLLAGVSDAELDNIANFYAKQAPGRAQTSAIGDPSAGKTAAAPCIGCHNEQGTAVTPAWPSLAGQDARSIAEALRAYKNGSRTNEIHKSVIAELDERAFNDIASYYASLSPAQPSAPAAPAGRSPVLVRNGLVASLDDRAINNVSSYYASLRPAQPLSTKDAPSARVPAIVSTAKPPGGRSVGGIISFRKNDPGRTASDNNRICLACHERGARVMWVASTHETRGLACTDCHTVMRDVSRKASLRTAWEPDTCFQCHKNKRAEIWRTSHMPVREGNMNCGSCHNPHGTPNESMLRRATVNDTCYQCHAEKRGPFLWEHAPVRENCLNCHDPHGSVNDFMLKVSRPRSCQQCHSALSGHPANPRNPQSVYALNRECQNCHSQIHGSNSPSGARLMR